MTPVLSLRIIAALAILPAALTAFAQEPKSKKDPKAEVEAKAAAAHEEVRIAFQDLIKDVRTNAEFKERWAKDGAAFQKKALAFLTAHPQHEDGARSMLWLGSVFTKLGLDDPAAEIFDAIRKNLPEKDTGRKANDALGALREAQAARDLAKKEFTLSFIPVGTDKKFDVKDWRGKVVIVYFWAAWCDVCRPQTEEIRLLYAKYKDKGVEVVGVSLDNDRAKLADAVAKQGISWPNHFDGKLWENEVARRWAVNAVPTVYVIDKAGKPATLEGRVQLEETLMRLLDIKAEGPAEKKEGAAEKKEEKK